MLISRRSTVICAERQRSVSALPLLMAQPSQLLHRRPKPPNCFTWKPRVVPCFSTQIPDNMEVVHRKTKCIGILGGMSPSSTELYYAKLNESVREMLGGLHSANCIIRSVDFEEIACLQSVGRWDDAGAMLGAAAADLEAGGAEILILATNTMHKVAPAIKSAITIPFLDIFSATAAAVVNAGCSRPLLMATAYTMEQDFCLDRLREAGLSPVVPNTEDRAVIHRIIFEELCKGEIHDKSRAVYERIAAHYLTSGAADSVILGCTEVGMLLNEDNVDAAVFDTAMIHCESVLELALSPT